ncbi:MAG TPA: hypothetical protein VHQ41_01680 [Patescibacteria group bacterium]|jgi:hypothetical protein|nr:hypothetical protein [Patescibacteria group bacterium]
MIVSDIKIGANLISPIADAALQAQMTGASKYKLQQEIERAVSYLNYKVGEYYSKMRSTDVAGAGRAVTELFVIMQAEPFKTIAQVLEHMQLSPLQGAAVLSLRNDEHLKPGDKDDTLMAVVLIEKYKFSPPGGGVERVRATIEEDKRFLGIVSRWAALPKPDIA